MNKSNQKQFTLIAHRGASYDAPENTFEAFDLALEMGFDNIETDVQLSSDGRCILIHDDSLYRTTGTHGLVAETGIAKIKSLHAGLWFEGPDDGAGSIGPLAYPDAFIPTLDEFLERYGGKIHIHLELKSTQPALPVKVMESLENWGVIGQHTGDYLSPGLTISSFHVEQLERSVVLMPEVAHGWLLEKINQSSLKVALDLGLAGIYPNASKVTKHQIEIANESGVSVRTWGIGNSVEALKRAYRSGATGTTVDWPVKAYKILASI
tara:strand:- start:10795 stop:11592 length:798 start_codon:yes stop_codon:yes gene_type:complete